MINNLTTQQAFMISTQEIFYGSAVLFVALIGLVWFARRTHGGAGADAAAGAHWNLLSVWRAARRAQEAWLPPRPA